MLITKELAHVIQDENHFAVEVRSTGAPNQFESEFTVGGTHPYLYENQSLANHVSGTSFLDTGRQLFKAICHLFYDVPIDNRFVIRSVNMNFTRWAKLKVPIRALIDCQTETTTVRGKNCLTVSAQVTFFQEGREIGTSTGHFTTFPLEIENFLMQRQYRQAPVTAHAKPKQQEVAGETVA